MPSTTFASLPDELLLEVISYLNPVPGIKVQQDAELARRNENQSRTRGLHSLTLTSLNLHRLVQPVLYESYIHPEHNPLAAHQLLRTLCYNPALAQHLQYIEVLNVTGQSLNDRQNPAMKCEDVVATWPFMLMRVQCFIDYLDLQGHWQLWFGLFLAGYMQSSSAALGLIVLLAPNLLDAAIGEFHTDINSILNLKQHYLVMGELRTLWIRQSFDHEELSERTVNVASMPVSENTLIIDSRVNMLFNNSRSDYPRPRETAVLALDMCDVGPRHLSFLLKPCSGLREFACRWGSTDVSKPYRKGLAHELNLPDLNIALTPHQDTLQFLLLDTLESGWLVSIHQNLPGIGSLRHFTALKLLDVSGFVLWGDTDEGHGDESLAELLPMNLEMLTIRTEWDDDVHWSLMGLAKDREAALPHLSTVDCSWRPAPRGMETTILKEQFTLAGLKLHIRESKKSTSD